MKPSDKRDPNKPPAPTSNAYYEKAKSMSNQNPAMMAVREVRNINGQLQDLLEENPWDQAAARDLFADRDRVFNKFPGLKDDPDLTLPTKEDFGITAPEVIDLVSSSSEDEEELPDGLTATTTTIEEAVAPAAADTGPSAKTYKNLYKFKGYQGNPDAETGGRRRTRRRRRNKTRTRSMQGGRRRRHRTARRSRRHRRRH